MFYHVIISNIRNAFKQYFRNTFIDEILSVYKFDKVYERDINQMGIKLRSIHWDWIVSYMPNTSNKAIP